MRVLLTTPAGLGHIHPTVPLAQAMVAQGHDVLWAAPPDGVDHVRQAGFRAVAVGSAGLTHPKDVMRRYPEQGSLPPAEVPDFLFGKMFGAIATPDRLPDLLALALEWRPNLVVADGAEFAGHIVAAEIGVPSITKGFGPILPKRRVAAAGEEVTGARTPALRRALRAHVPRHLPTRSPAVRTPRSASPALRPVPYDGRLEGSAPVPLPDGAAGAAIVYVTMGTVFNDPAPLQVVVDAVAGLDARVLVTVGPQAEPAMLGSQRPHVRVERYVPQTLALPQCDVVVSHAGSGTVLATLGLGLPQLCLPQGADQFLNAAAVAAAGAGISLMPEEATTEAVVGAVTRLLSDGSFRQAARRISDSIAAMPSPDDVAAVLESIQ